MPICNTEAIIAGLLRQLGSGNPCDDQLEFLVPALWELTAFESCGSMRLHMLNTKREIILALMGCEAYSIDTYDRTRRLDATTKADTQSDLRTQSQSTGNSTRFSKGAGATRYDESNTARSTGTVDRHDKSTETGDGTSFYRDDGKGYGNNNSQSTTSIDADDLTIVRDSVSSTANERGSRRDCNYEVSVGNNRGVGGGLPPLGIYGFTGSASEWRKYTQTEAQDTDTSTRATVHFLRRTAFDIREGQGTHDWSSQFLADIFWRDYDYDIRVAHDRTDTKRHQEAHARGDGDGYSENKDEAHNAAQGTVKSEATNGATRTGRKIETQTTVQLANSQRFRNLQLIYDQITSQIEHEKRHVRMGAPPRIAQLPCNCTGCCRCMPELRAIGYSLCHSLTH